MAGGYQKKYASSAMAVISKLVDKKSEKIARSTQEKIPARIKAVRESAARKKS